MKFLLVPTLNLPLRSFSPVILVFMIHGDSGASQSYKMLEVASRISLRSSILQAKHQELFPLFLTGLGFQAPHVLVAPI